MNHKSQGMILVTVLFLMMLVTGMTLLMQQTAWLELKMSAIFCQEPGETTVQPSPDS